MPMSEPARCLPPAPPSDTHPVEIAVRPSDTAWSCRVCSWVGTGLLGGEQAARAEHARVAAGIVLGEDVPCPCTSRGTVADTAEPRG